MARLGFLGRPGRDAAVHPARPGKLPDPVLGIPVVAWDRAAALLLAIWLALVLLVSLAWHPTPLYSVESDTISEYVSAARELMNGQLRAGHYESKSFGYPLALGATAFLVHGDYFLAARLLNGLSGAVGAGFAYLLFRGFLGAEAGWFVLAGLLLNPAYLRFTVEASTDVPAFALLMAATFLLLGIRRPRAAFASGLLAGGAVITRYSCLFLPVAGILTLAARRPRWRTLTAYAAGLAVPLAAWAVAARSLGQVSLGRANVMNMAYEIYGRNLPPEVFWSMAGGSFQTFWDVLRYRPATFLTRIGLNLGTRWLQDVRQLLPVWLGALAVPGLVLRWPRCPGWRAIALHMGLAYAALVPVFYLPRFGLYLIPFYLSGAVTLVLHLRLPLRGRRPDRPEAVRPRAALRALRPALLAALILASGARAIGELRGVLARAPHETRDAARLLRRIGEPRDLVMARKPNVAFLAGLGYAPLPSASISGYTGFLAEARRTGARYLFFSAAEEDTRPELAVLADSGITLPGLQQVAYRTVDPTRYYAIYEFTRERLDSVALHDGVLAALRRFADAHPGLARAHRCLGFELLDCERYREAATELDAAGRLDPLDLSTVGMQIYACERLGEYDREAEACERAISLGANGGWERACLGRALVRLGRYQEGVRSLQDAMRREPTNAEYPVELGQVRLARGESAAAARDFEQALALDPGDVRARLSCARAWRLAGDRRRALAILEPAAQAGSPEARELRALADSIRAGEGR